MCAVQHFPFLPLKMGREKKYQRETNEIIFTLFPSVEFISLCRSGLKWVLCRASFGLAEEGALTAVPLEQYPCAGASLHGGIAPRDTHATAAAGRQLAGPQLCCVRHSCPAWEQSLLLGEHREEEACRKDKGQEGPMKMVFLQCCHPPCQLCPSSSYLVLIQEHVAQHQPGMDGHNRSHTLPVSQNVLLPPHGLSPSRPSASIPSCRNNIRKRGPG